MRYALLLVVVAAAAGCGGQSRQLAIHVSPATGTFDVPFTIRVAGLPADRRAALTFSGRARNGRTVRGTIAVRPDSHGEAVLRNVFLYSHLSPLDGWPRRLTLTVAAGRETKTVHATRTPVPTSTFRVSEERPATDGFYGEWTRPPHVHRHTAILLFGGSEGGMNLGQLADTLVAHGYPVLDLAYFSEPGLPPSLERIPLEYFERALRWLGEQPAADPTRLVTFGISRGGEASLLVASTFPRLVHAAVAYVPSSFIVPSPLDVNVPAWTLHGKPVHGERTATSPGRYGWIRVERISGPVFAVGGGADDLWPSELSVQEIRERLLAHQRRDAVTLTYPNAGHRVGEVVPLQVDVPAAGYGIEQSRYGTLDLGGSPRADEAAREASWPKLLRFLAQLN